MLPLRPTLSGLEAHLLTVIYEVSALLAPDAAGYVDFEMAEFVRTWLSRDTAFSSVASIYHRLEDRRVIDRSRGQWLIVKPATVRRLRIVDGEVELAYDAEAIANAWRRQAVGAVRRPKRGNAPPPKPLVEVVHTYRDVLQRHRSRERELGRTLTGRESIKCLTERYRLPGVAMTMRGTLRRLGALERIDGATRTENRWRVSEAALEFLPPDEEPDSTAVESA